MPERVQLPPRDDARLLNHVVGFGARPDDAGGVSAHERPVPVDERLECGDVTVDGSIDEDLVTDEPQSIGRVTVALGYRHATPQ